MSVSMKIWFHSSTWSGLSSHPALGGAQPRQAAVAMARPRCAFFATRFFMVVSSAGNEQARTMECGNAGRRGEHREKVGEIAAGQVHTARTELGYTVTRGGH